MKIVPLKSESKMNLQNDGELAVFFIGVGNAFSKRHYQNNILIVKGKDHLMIDCGTKTPQALYEIGVNITDVRNFLITHSHADHIGGLEEVCLVNRYMYHQKPTIVINETYQHMLWDMSLRGGCAYSEEHAGMVLTFVDFWDIIRPKWLIGFPRETLEADVGGINIKLFRTKHIPDSSDSWETSFWSCGLIIDDRVFFSSDTRFDEDLVLSFEDKFNFDVLFHDCQFWTGGVHASIDEINIFPSDIKKKMYLMHYGDDWEKHEDKVKDYGFADLCKQNHFYIFE